MRWSCAVCGLCSVLFFLLVGCGLVVGIGRRTFMHSQLENSQGTKRIPGTRECCTWSLCASLCFWNLKTRIYSFIDIYISMDMALGASQSVTISTHITIIYIPVRTNYQFPSLFTLLKVLQILSDRNLDLTANSHPFDATRDTSIPQIPTRSLPTCSGYTRLSPPMFPGELTAWRAKTVKTTRTEAETDTNSCWGRVSELQTKSKPQRLKGSGDQRCNWNEGFGSLGRTDGANRCWSYYMITSSDMQEGYKLPGGSSLFLDPSSLLSDR